MNRQLHVSIPKPCGENLSAMPQCTKGLYCASCKHHLLDLRGKTLVQVNNTLKDVSGVCIAVDTKYTKRSWAWTERWAAYLRRNSLPRMAALLVACCLFLSSCHHRRRSVTAGFYKNPDKKTEITDH